jgi:hypothetical protein
MELTRHQAKGVFAHRHDDLCGAPPDRFGGADVEGVFGQSGATKETI